MSKGKKYVDSAKLYDRATLFDPAEGIETMLKTAKAKFDETVEIHVRLGVDSRHADQQVRGAVVLPNGTGQTIRMMVACGHVDSLDPIHVTQKGDHGNTVHFFLINPQGYDTKEDADGSILKGVQDTGMVLYMNFSEDGAKITFDNHATLLNKNLAATQNKEILLFEQETP